MRKECDSAAAKKNPYASKLLYCFLLALSLSACGTLKQPLTFFPEALPPASVERPYAVSIAVSGHSTPVFRIFVKEGDLPPGLVLHHDRHSDTAEIRGMPETAGVFRFTLAAECYGTNFPGQKGERFYEISVATDRPRKRSSESEGSQSRMTDELRG